MIGELLYAGQLTLSTKLEDIFTTLNWDTHTVNGGAKKRLMTVEQLLTYDVERPDGAFLRLGRCDRDAGGVAQPGLLSTCEHWIGSIPRGTGPLDRLALPHWCVHWGGVITNT